MIRPRTYSNSNGKSIQNAISQGRSSKKWDKLAKKTAWDLSTVKAKAKVRSEVKVQGKTVHFGTLMNLCREKHLELAPDLRSYKGRVVFRGDSVKDESGFFAVFSEQGTSASHMAAAKFMDAIARPPGCDGEDSDVVGAYTQVSLEDIEKEALMGEHAKCDETWITLPRSQRPTWWDTIEPVCRLRLNLYGHPLTGLHLEKFCQSELVKEGFEKIKGWECLYKHHELGLFLSVYADDLKMDGQKTSAPCGSDSKSTWI